MSDNYSSYLLAIAAIIAAVTACLVFFLKPGRKERAVPPSSPVTYGSISVFFDRTGNVTIIPYVKDRFGTGRATSGVVFLKNSCSASKLGSAIRSSMESCRGAEPCTNRELLEKLKTRDWVAFSADKRNISIYYKDHYGIVFNTTTRKAEGVYEFNHNGAEKSLPPDTGDKVLGDTVLKLLKKCR